MSSDLDVFKDIPGYKSILKSVLKSQIQHLLDQLSKHTGEESVILTANLDDGVLSHQGSGTGKSFLEGRDEIKSQFLGFCLKSHHRKQMAENRVSPYQRPDPKTPNRLGPMSKVPQKSPRPLTSVGSSSSTPIHRATDETVTSVTQDPAPSLENMSGLASISRGKEITLTDRNGAVVKVERAENSASSKELRVTSIESTVTNFPPSLELSHTQISGQSGTVNNASVDLNSDSTTHLSAATNDTSFDNDDSNGATSIKIEPITENEMELEITGVEPGSSSNLSPEKWGPSSSTYSGTGASGDEMTSSTDATSYSPVPMMLYYKDENNSIPACVPIANFSNAVPIEQLSFGQYTLNSPSSLRSALGNMIRKELLSQDDIDTEARRRGKKKQCPVCQHWFFKQADLTRHMVRHTGERPFQCELCLRSFTRKDTLKGHLPRCQKNLMKWQSMDGEQNWTEDNLVSDKQSN